MTTNNTTNKMERIARKVIEANLIVLRDPRLSQDTKDSLKQNIMDLCTIIQGDEEQVDWLVTSLRENSQRDKWPRFILDVSEDESLDMNLYKLLDKLDIHEGYEIDF